MSVEEKKINSETKEAQKKPMKRLSGRIFKWVFILLSCLILLLIGIFIFIQTDYFDKIALGYALDKINASLSQKGATINAESLEGNLLKGFILKNGAVKVKGDTLLKFSSIEAGYNIWTLFDKEISVQNIILKNPQINLTKVKDKNDSLIWNLDYLLSSDKEKDTASSEFDWGITAENVSVENGSVRILEENSSGLPLREIVMPELDSFEIGKFDVTNLNLNLSAKYFPDIKDLNIKSLNFRTNSAFNVNNFSLQANINEKDSVTTIKDLSIKTDRSDVEINELKMEGFDPFESEDYEKFNDNNTKLNLETKPFNIADLTFFLPELRFLDSTASLNLIAQGNYGDLNIEKLDLQLPNSKFSFAGNVKNLNKPSELYFDVTGKNIEIDPRDTKINLPGIPIPDYSYLGKVYIPSLTYRGEPERFSSDFDVRSSAGNVNGNIYMDLTQNITRYKGDLSASNVNVGKIIKDKTLESNINGDFNVDAAGFDYRTMAGKLNYSLQRTNFFGQNISKSDGLLNFNKGNINLNIAYDSDALRVKTAGKVNISNLKNISYDLKGTANNLNIGAFSKDNSQKSNLSFDFDMNGRGFDPNSITGNFKIKMNASTFADYKIPSTPLDVEIDQSGNIKKISMKNNFVDLTAEGSFSFNSLSSLISNNINKIRSELNKKFYDSLITADSSQNNFSTNCVNLGFQYTINVKDLAPLYTFTGNDTINFKGNLEGSLSDSCGIMFFVSRGLIKELTLKDSLLITRNALINLNIKNDVKGYRLSKFDADAEISTDKIVVSKFPLDTTLLKVNFFENRNIFNIKTMKDSTMKFFTQGSLRDSLIFNFDTLQFKYQNFSATNINDLIVQYKNVDSNASINFRQFGINSFNQRVSIAGQYSMSDSSDITLSASNVNLITVQKLINKDLDTNNMLSGKIRYLDITYKGVPETPQLDIETVSEELSIGSTVIGRLDANVIYKDYEFIPDITFSNKNNTGSFKLTGSVPALITFSDVKLDSVQRAEVLSNREANLNAIAKNFQLRVFQQLIPYTSNLEGILNGKISLLGTPEKPVLTGNMDVNKGKFFVSLTKMNYNFNAGLSTKDEKLLINRSKIFIADEESRFISTTGFVDFTGFVLNEINLSMTGDVKALDKDNGLTELGMEGDLWVGSGRNSLTLKGNPDRFDLTGNLVLVKGNVVFNPFLQEAYNIYTDDFIYGVVIDSSNTVLVPAKSEIDSTNKGGNDPLFAVVDSSKVKIDSSKSDEEFTKLTLLQNPDSIVVLKDLHLNPFEKIIYVYNNKNLKKVAKEKSGKFFYNILVTTSENVFLKFIVNEKSQQEFFGEIKTEDLNIYNDVDYTMSGRGKITLGDNAYYKFFRKFDATGNVKFYGPITNPELNISAQYKGYATTGATVTGQENLQDIVINMKVTGEAKNPKLTISLDKGGSTEAGSNATSDAISFLLFGKFQDQLSFGESTSFGANLGASFLSSYLSSSLETIFPFLINTSFNYVDSKSGTVAQNTDVRFTAALGDAVIRFGGQIFKGIANTDIILDYPLNKILKINSLSNNLIFRFERVYDPFYNENDISNTNGTRVGGLIYYKIKF